MHKSILPQSVLAACLLLSAPHALAQATLHGIGDLPGGITLSDVRDATRVGNVIHAVGGSAATSGSIGSDTAVYWNSTTGLAAIPNLATNPTATNPVFASAITPSATYIASRSRPATTGGSRHAVRVTTAGLTSLDLGFLDGFPAFSAANAISSDGSVLYGLALYEAGGKSQAVRYTASGPTITAIPFLNGGDNTNSPASRGTSADGSVMVGTSTNTTIDGGDFSGLGNQAFRYVHGAGLSALPFLTGGTWNTALAVTPDGGLALLGGDSTAHPNGEIYLFRAATGMIIPLGAPGQATGFSSLGGITGNGAVAVVTFGSQEDESVATFHNRRGWHTLREAAGAAGATFTGWTIERVAGISSDGTLVWGQGRHNGAQEGWVLSLPAGYLENYDPATPAIVGAWSTNTPGAQGSALVVFLRSGYYYHVEDPDPDEGVSSAGFERGTYTWDPATKAFAMHTLQDTNGDIGLSDLSDTSGMTITVTGNTLNLNIPGEGTSVANRVTGGGPVVGAWVFGDAATPDKSAVVALFANGNYLLAEDGEPGDPTGHDGIERGTYTWNSSTGNFAATPVTDTNGEFGFSHIGNNATATANGDKFIFNDGTEPFTGTSVRSSGRLPGIVGTWQAGNTAAGGAVVAFLSNGYYYHIQNANAEEESLGGSDGFERGTYTWNQLTGALTINTIQDTNGSIGLSGVSGASGLSFTPAGTTGVFTDPEGSTDVQRVTTVPGSVVGTYVLGNPGTPDGSVILVLLLNGSYYIANDEDATTATGDPNGQDGIEHGTYTWDSVTGMFNSSQTTDTNGEWGLSNPQNQDYMTLSSDGSVLTIADADGATDIRRALDSMDGLPGSGLPGIASQPATLSVDLGASASFSVTAVAEPNLTYQWYRNGDALAGATGTTYSISEALVVHAGVYTVTLTNAQGSSSSNGATLTVVAPLRPGFFDANGYLTLNGDVAAVIGDAVDKADQAWLHYIQYGIFEGRTDGDFNAQAYLAQYPNVATSYRGAALHWYNTGRAAGLRIPAGFDVTGYFARNLDIAAYFTNDKYGAWLHYYNYGLFEGRSFDTNFIAGEYLELNLDLKEAGGGDLQGAVLHWLSYGHPIEDRMGRVPIGFNVENYLARYPDLAAAFANVTPVAVRNVAVWHHYIAYGTLEGRSDGDFEAYDYLATNADLAAIFDGDVQTAALHWFFYGRREGRRIPFGFDVVNYRALYPDLVVFSGDDLYGCWLHFRDTGINEGRIYDNKFRAADYLALNPDIFAAVGNNHRDAFLHWIYYGQFEGRQGKY